MSELFTFKTTDGRFQFTVKGSFLNQCDKPDTFGAYDLMTKYKLNQFLHNPTGPAITRLKDNMIEYWIDGQQVSKEEGEKIAHNHSFNNKLFETINKE